MMMAANLKFGFGLVAILLIYRIIVTTIMIVLQTTTWPMRRALKA